MRAVQHGVPAVQTHKYPQNWRKEVGGRRETLGTCPGKQLCARLPRCRKSAPVTTKGFPSLPLAPAHTPACGCPGSPQAGSKSPGSRTPNLYFCMKSLLWSAFPGTALPSGGSRHRSLGWPHAPATGSGCPRLGALLPEEAFTREEQRKVLQKRTRNIAALGRAPALAGKLRHALEGMRVPLEDNQRF